MMVLPRTCKKFDIREIEYLFRIEDIIEQKIREITQNISIRLVTINQKSSTQIEINLILQQALRHHIQHFIICLIKAINKIFMRISSNPTEPISNNKSTSFSSKLEINKNITSRVSTSGDLAIFTNLGIKNNPIFRKSISKNSDDKQFNVETYRIMAQKFSCSIHQFYGKFNRNALGELQEPYKIPLSKYSKEVKQEGLIYIFDEHIDKFVRNMLRRNYPILKTRDQYMKAYSNKIGIPADDQYPQCRDNFFSKNSDRQKQSYSHFVPSGRLSFSCRLQKKQAAMMSFIETKLSCGDEGNQTNASLPKFNMGDYLKNYLKVSEKLKKRGKPNSRYKHLLSNAIKNSQLQEQEKNKNINKILLCRKNQEIKREYETLAKFKRNTNFSSFFIQESNQPYKLKDPRSVHSSHCERKMRNQFDKGRIHEKILVLNKDASIIQEKVQEYRPRSRCWKTGKSLRKSCSGQATQKSVGWKEGRIDEKKW